MDTIRLTGVRADGTHGVLDFEHEQPQPFVVDAVLHVDLTCAGHSDELADTVDYGQVAGRIVDIIRGDHVDLIERLAARIADTILAEQPLVAAVNITVHKPQAPISVPFDDVAVGITRVRDHADDAGRLGLHGGTADGTDTDGMDINGTAAGGTASDESAVSHHAVVALGGNIGDVAGTLRAAVADIDALEGTQIIGISPLYRTAAWGMPDGTPDFLNAVVELSTTRSAVDLLSGLQSIETAHGRTRKSHWSSRTLDLDIIDFDGIIHDSPMLTLPHPRAWQRAFVLAPWHALDPDAVLGGRHGGSVADLLAAAPDADQVTVDDAAWMTGGSRGGESDNSVESNDSVESDGSDESDSPVVSDGFSASNEPAEPAEPAEPDSYDAAGFDTIAVVAMDSVSQNAEALFRSAIVSIDGIPGNQVEGISPLYHVADFDGPDGMSAVMQLETKLGARGLIAALQSVETALGNKIELDLVDMHDVVCDAPDCRVPWPAARSQASVLAPWMDMDPDAKLGGDPVSFLLAMAPDAGRVGMLSDHWIIEGAL